MRLLVIFSFITCCLYSQSKDIFKGKPSTLDECYPYLDNIFDDTSKYTFMKMPEGLAVSRLHHGLGMWIRNEWGLWKRSDLKKYFEEKGIFHPDDMSGIILVSYHRRLNEKDVALSEQIQERQGFYRQLEKKGDSISYADLQSKWDEEAEEFKKLFNTGDTVIISIHAPEKRFFQTYATSVTGYAVIRDTSNLRAEIIKINHQKGRVPDGNVGDTVKVDLFSVRLIPPKNWHK